MSFFTNKRFLSYILIFAVIICSFFVISNKSKEPDKTEIVFWTLQLSTYDKYVNNIIGEFEKENPDVKIKWIDIPYSEGEKRTLAAILTDNPPDLVNLTPDFSLLLAQKKALYTFDEDKVKDYPPALCNVLKYGNKYFGIPFYATSAITLFNKNSVKSKNYELSSLPRTYDELFKFDNSATYLTMINFSENDTLLKLLNKYGINSPEKLRSPESIKLFSEFKRLYDNNLIPKESVTQTHRDALEQYMSGKISFLITGANFLNMIKENAPEVYKNTIILPQLTGTTKLYDFSLMNFVIPKKSKNPETALKFALFFTNKKNQSEFAKMTPILPVNKDSLNDEYFFDAGKHFDDIGSYFEYTEKTKDTQTQVRMISAAQLSHVQPFLTGTKNKKELNTISSNYIQEILINNKDINTALNNFASDWEKL